MTAAPVPITIPAPPTRATQATTIEQSRAMAEVQAAVIMARQLPRDIPASVKAMTESCKVKELAERAFFRYSRGGGQITGPSVHLAREIARCFGNLNYGITELERDTANRQSQILAFAWDLETNTRATTTFIVPWLRDSNKKADGPSDLTAVRDIYENNANMGARRVREMIFSVLPTWYVEQAQAICRHTIENGSEKPLSQRVSEAVAAFERINITQAQLVDKIGKPVKDWLAGDVATLLIIFQSIQRGEARAEDEFTPPAPPEIDVDAVTGGKAPRAPRTTPPVTDDKPAASNGAAQ
jgi:hypothetical protein